MLFALLGGVNWNVLNAQEPGIKIGEDKQDASPTGMYPMYGSWYCSISQQIFTAAEIGEGAGNITSIAFKTSTAAKNHNITVWLLNTTNSTLDSPMAFGDSDKVFDGEWNSGAADTWSQITLDRAFSYNGDNLVVILQENGTGSTDKFYKYTKGAGTTLQYKYATYVTSLEGLSGYYTTSYNNVFGLTIESAVDEGLIPGTPANLTASVIDHVSVSLTWEEGENAQAYNVYKNGVLFKNVKTNSCIVDGLDPETTYEFTVTTLNFDRESAASNVATATTPAAPKTRTIVFALGDPGYGDGWNSNTMTISYGTYSEDLTLETGSYFEYEREIPIGAEVTLTYTGRYYASENDFEIRYKDGDVIWQMGQGSLSNTTLTKKFTVEGTEPSVVASENSITLGSVRMGNYWTEKNQVSETFNITAKYTTITEVSCNNTFFDVDYDGTSVVTVGYDKTANVTGEQTGTITIKSTDFEDVTVGVSATAYAPVTPDVIELKQEVEFTAAGAYENTPDFATLHDDYILPGEATEGSTPDAVYHFTMENEGTLTVNVTGNNAIAAVYKAEDMEGSGPMANNNFKGIVPAPAAETTFEYTFEDVEEGKLSDQFTVTDADGDGENWKLFIENNYVNKHIISYSWYSQQIFTPENYIVTNKTYLITENSRLTWDYKGSNYPDKYAVVISEDGVNFDIVVEKSVNYVQQFTSDYADLGAYAGKIVHIGFVHHKCTNEYSVAIDNIRLTDGNTRNRSTEPQINAVQYPAGKYYLVAAAEEAFTVSIETASLPEPGEFAYTAPADGAKEQDNPVLTWDAAQYATEYKVYLGTESTLTEENLVATVTAPSYQTERLLNNTQYFWKVDAVNAKGTKKGEVYSFVTPLDVPQNVAVSASTIVEGETVTVTWDAIENVTYNVYVDDAQVNDEPITATSYELTGLAYNVSGYNITVTANHTLGESPMSAAVNVKVGGKFTVTVTVTDGTNPIEGAMVTLKGADEYAKDELGNSLQYYTLEATTGSDGIAVIENVRLLQPSGFSYYVITAEYGIYDDAYGYIYNYNEIVNGQNYPVEIYMELPRPENVATDKEAYLVGDDVVLSWDAIAAAKGYNVYKADDEDPLNAELLTEATFTIEDVECGSTQYAVTAVYEDYGESNRESKYVQVTGEGSVIVTVTDGTNPIKGAKVVLADNTYTTDADGKFEADIMEGYYTVTVTRYDFEDKEGVGFYVSCGETIETTIVMTPYSSATIDNVVAKEADGNALVTWEAEYEKYNVYRMNVATEDVVGPIATVTEETYTDLEWASLENGTYQYGVNVASSENNVFGESFSSSEPAGWTRNGKGEPTNLNGYAYSGYGYYLGGSNAAATVTTPGIEIPAGATLEFQCFNGKYQSVTSNVKVQEVGSDTWNVVRYLTETHSGFTLITIPLNEYAGKTVQIQFEKEYTNTFGYLLIDDVSIKSSTSPSTITWSNELVKRTALTFNNAAGDNDWSNPANWAGGVLPTAEDNVVVNAVANITGTVAVNNLTINARLNVMPEAAFTVNGTITDANEYGNLYIEDGAQIFQKNEGVNAYFRMIVKNPEEWSSDNKAGWQFISSPLLDAEVAAAATKSDNAYQPSDYDMYKYNGSLENEWVNHKDGEGINLDFEAYFTEGRGYMYSHQARTIVTLGGELNPATTFDYEVSYNGEENPLANLHLLGNPFTFNMDWQYVNVSNVYDGYAILNAAGNNYVYATEGTIPVGDGFFVQAIGSEPEMSYGMRGSKETSSNINVIARGNAGEDNVIINFAGEGEGFRKLQGFNEDNARIFVENEGRRYGIANVEANATEVELSFVAAQMGNYTISLDVNGKFETVVLVDRFTGVETNMLLEDEYSFTATSNDSPNRFVVRLGGAKTESASFVYQSGDELIINAEGAIEIIDMMGRVVYSSEMNNGRVDVSNFNNAAYVVRALNEGKVQKVVIY